MPELEIALLVNGLCHITRNETNGVVNYSVNLGEGLSASAPTLLGALASLNLKPSIDSKIIALRQQADYLESVGPK